MQSYFAAKKRLFTDFSPKIAVTNVQDVYSQRLTATDQFGKGTPYYYQDGKIWICGNSVDIDKLQIFGEFQYSNICCAMAMLPEAQEKAQILLPKLKPVPGRFEKISNNPQVIVDYAHKPEAMRTVLENLRQHTKGRIITVFGCGGDRDAGKRSIMGNIAQELSEVVVVTDDNPRFEEPAIIRKQILKGCMNAIEIDSRDSAIQYAITLAKPEDSVAILGKGQEKFQKIKHMILPFDDVEVARQALAHAVC